MIDEVRIFHVDNLDQIDPTEYVGVFAADLHLRERIWKDRADIVGDTYNSLDQIANICKTLDLPLFLGGDNFDVPKPHSSDVQKLKSVVNNLPHATYGIDGNHDYSKPSWLNVCGIINLDLAPVEVNGVTIVGIRSYMKQEQDALLQRLDDLEGTNVDYLIMHQLADFIVPNFANFAIDNIPACVSTCLFGDVHKHGVSLSSHGTYCAYPGSIAPMKLDETDNKTVILMRKDTYGTPIDLVQLHTRKIVNLNVRNESEYLHANSNQFLGELKSHYTSTGFKPIVRLHYRLALDDVTTGRSLSKLREFLEPHAHLFVQRIFEKTEATTEVKTNTTTQEIIDSFISPDDDALGHAFVSDIVTSPVPVQMQLTSLREKIGIQE